MSTKSRLIYNENMIDYQQCFIDNMKFYRRKKRISQSQLAEACNVSNGTIGNIECGITKPSFDLILLIADRLGVKPELLFYSDEQASFDLELSAPVFTRQQIQKIKKTLSAAVSGAIKKLESAE